MNKTGQAAREIHISDNADHSRREGGLHPLSRVIVTFLYILMVVSFSIYDLMGLSGMVLYLLVHILWYEISVSAMLRRVWPVLLLTGVAGIAGPVMNREVYVVLGDVAITYGMLSMITLMLKGMFCVMASYILAVTVGIGQICHALRLLHVPKEIITVVMLMHRYLMVLIKEVERMQLAYRLRAPHQRGLRFGTWGSFVGLLLLRSMDRAEEVYESMKLRGFYGGMPVSSPGRNTGMSFLYVLLWGFSLLFLRLFPIFPIVGNML